jgi:bla regulator protein BlaR1
VHQSKRRFLDTAIESEGKNVRMRVRNSYVYFVGTWVLAAVGSLAQTGGPPLKFEVASIKPPDPTFRGASSSRDAGEGIDIRNVSVRNLISLAYGLRDFQLIGGPSWIDSESYDVIAKAPSREVAAATDAATAESMDQRKTRFQRVNERLRSLLADRFGLVVHHETRNQPVYLLTLAENGSKLVPVPTPDGPPHKEEGRGRSQGFAVPIEMLVATLSNATRLTVVDKTGLVGRFDYTLNWDPVPLSANPDSPPPDSKGPTIFIAVQKQLGLRLESGKAPVDVVVVDHVNHPSAN